MRWVLRSVLALALLVFLAVVALVLMPTEQIARLAADRFEEITGRQLVMEGAVRPSFFPTLGVQTGPVSVSNATWSREGEMLRAEGLRIALDLRALMRGEVRITAIEADAPQVVLERNAEGQANWEFGGSAGGSATPGMAGEGTPFTLDLAEVTGGHFTYVDHATGRRVELSGLEGTARIPAFRGEAVFDFKAVTNGQPFAAQLALADFAPFLEGKLGDVALTVQAGAADLRFAGRAGWAPMAAEGALEARLGDLSETLRLIGATPGARPQGLGAGRVEVSGRLTVTEAQSLHLRGGTVVLDDNRLAMEADLTTAGERPKLTAQLTAGPLRLAAAMGGAGGEIGGGARGGTQAEGWPVAPLDVSGLGAMDASVALSAESVDLGVVRFGATRIATTIDRGRAVFDLRQIAAYQGTISGQFVVNGRSGLSVGGDLTLAGLAMQPLLMDLGGYDRLIGSGDLSLKFLGVGNSVDAIMRSLSGSGRLSLGKGELRGLDVAGMLRTLDLGYVGEGQRTIFDGVSGSFTMENGVLSNDDLSLRAPYVTATGDGTVDLGARLLDYRLRPVALAAVDGSGGVMVPLLITGPWASPRFRLDLEALARERFEEQARALEERAKLEAAEAEARARAELARRAEEELGIVAQEGESLEDAARRRAQEALGAETGRLLERLLGSGN